MSPDLPHTPPPPPPPYTHTYTHTHIHTRARRVRCQLYTKDATNSKTPTWYFPYTDLVTTNFSPDTGMCAQSYPFPRAIIKKKKRVVLVHEATTTSLLMFTLKFLTHFNFRPNSASILTSPSHLSRMCSPEAAAAANASKDKAQALRFPDIRGGEGNLAASQPAFWPAVCHRYQQLNG